MKSQKGFTLIELLVVIVIIGILASVVLVSIKSSRDKSGDKAIISQLRQLQTQASIYYDTNGSFGSGLSIGLCPSVANTSPANWSLFYDLTIKTINQQAGVFSGGVVSGSGLGASWTKTACAGTGDGLTWATAIILKSSSTAAWCVDSTGTSKTVSVSTDNPSEAINISSSSNYFCN